MTVRVFMVVVILVRLLGTGKAMIWENNELLATMEGSGAEKLVEKGSLGGNEGKDWWR